MAVMWPLDPIASVATTSGGTHHPKNTRKQILKHKPATGLLSVHAAWA